MPFAKLILRRGGFVISAGLRAAAQNELDRLRGGLRLGLPSLRTAFRPKFASRAAYFRHCKAALRRALAPYWNGSHAALKQHLRGLLHARRRDVRFLGGLLRATATPAALAIFMLAANAAPAENNCYFTFSQYVSASNPFDGKNLGNFSAPAFADLDSDGDADAVIGTQDGLVRYYRNTGTRLAPEFTLQASGENPFNAIDVGYAAVPSFGDLDADGDMDVLIGNSDGQFRYFRNTGDRVFPAFTERTGADNPFNGVDLGDAGAPALADLDGDGDLDVIAGEYTGVFTYFKNNGNANFPSFSEQAPAENPMDGFDVVQYSRPAYLDIDKDGDLDLFAGSNDGDVHYFENIGTAIAPEFVEPGPFENPMFGFDTGDYSHPAFADLDGDGDLDTLIGGTALAAVCAQNVSTSPLPLFEEKTGAANPFAGIAAGVGNNKSVPALGDLDADGDLDALIGDFDGTIRYFKNTGTKIAPVFAKQTGPANPLNGFFVPVGRSKPALADMDGDGDLDLFTGMYSGQFFYLKNTGTAMDPVFEQQFGPSTPLDGVDMSGNSAPVVLDIDADGDFDVFTGSADGLTILFRNQGSAVAPFLMVSPDNFLPSLADFKYNAPAFVDIDTDGDLDAISGVEYGNLPLFLNTGTPRAAAFEAQANAASPFFRTDVGDLSALAFADLDGDGDEDAVVGEQDGNINYFERSGDCEPLSLSCNENVTLSLNASGAITINPDDLLQDTRMNTAMSVSPPVLFCGSIGASTPVTLTVTNLFGASGSCIANVNVVDDLGPTVYLNGNDSITLNCGDTYTEQGAGVFDGCDAFVDVVIGGSTVNTNDAGTYIVTYTATDGSGNTTQITRSVTVVGSCTSEDGVQSADQDGNFVISLSELLRVIQFYNSLGYHCAANPGDTEDGYIPGVGANKACAPYDTDYNPQDWVISLTELLRVIQFYNSLGYNYCPGQGTEDGFCPGPA